MAAPRLDVDLTAVLPRPSLDDLGLRPLGGVSLLPEKRFAAGFVLEGPGSATRPLLEVCGPEVTLSLRFGGPDVRRSTGARRSPGGLRGTR